MQELRKTRLLLGRRHVERLIAQTRSQGAAAAAPDADTPAGQTGIDTAARVQHAVATVQPEDVSASSGFSTDSPSRQHCMAAGRISAAWS